MSRGDNLVESLKKMVEHFKNKDESDIKDKIEFIEKKREWYKTRKHVQEYVVSVLSTAIEQLKELLH